MHIVLRLIIAILATWRLTHLLAKEKGPWDIFLKIRKGLGQGFWSKLVKCFQCLSVWIASPFAFFVGGSVIEIIVLWLAISGAAIIIEERIRDPFAIEAGEENGMLRSNPEGDHNNHGKDISHDSH